VFDREGWNWGCIFSLLGCVLVWTIIVVAVVRWWDVIGDWLLVAAVIAFVLGVYWAVLSFIDTLTDYWRSYRDD
jgi:hypothetical protein